MWKANDRLTCWDVLEFVRKIHGRKEDFEDGDLAERIKRFGVYELQEVQVSELRRGYYQLDEDAIETYAQKPLETLPPIVLGEKYGESYDVVDGNHRVEAQILRGLPTILAFVPILDTRIEDDEEEQGDEV